MGDPRPPGAALWIRLSPDLPQARRRRLWTIGHWALAQACQKATQQRRPSSNVLLWTCCASSVSPFAYVVLSTSTDNDALLDSLIDGHLVEQATCNPGYSAESFVPSSTSLLEPHQAWEWNALPASGYATGAPYHQVANPQYSPSSAGPAVTTPAATTLPPSLVSFFAFDGQTHHL